MWEQWEVRKNSPLTLRRPTESSFVPLIELARPTSFPPRTFLSSLNRLSCPLRVLVRKGQCVVGHANFCRLSDKAGERTLAGEILYWCLICERMRIDFYKKHCATKFNLHADHFYFSLCCCFISTNSWQNVPRMLSVHTGLFVTSGQS